MRELPEGAELRIAKIKSTTLGREDHGIFTCYLNLDYGGGGQGAGGYALDEPLRDANDKFIRRRGSDYGMEFVIRIMKACGVSRWEDIPGRTVYAVSSWGQVHAIIPLPTEGKEEDGFWFDDLRKEFFGDEEDDG